MEDKIQKQTWVALRHALAKQTHCTEKEAASFLDSLVHQLTLGLQNEQSVRINNLGTFRLQAVAPRKSVHVGTGEAITIAGYNKLAFAPEASVKASMNDTMTPRLTPETDPLRKLGEQADEILDILADMGQAPIAPTAEEVIPQSQITEEPQSPSVPSIEKTPQKAAHAIESEKEAQKETIETIKHIEEQQKKKSHIGLTILLTVIFFILLCIGAFFFLQHKLVTWMDSLREKSNNTELVIPEREETVTEQPIITTLECEAIEEKTIEGKSIEEDNIHPQYESFITTEEMHADSRLAWMAYRYWGKKELWVYIYDANRHLITDPNFIKTGTPIRVPQLTKEQQDLNNPTTKRFIEQILNELN